MDVACCGWVQIGTSGIQIAVGWRGAIGARGWPWFCSPWVAVSVGFGGCGRKWICFAFIIWFFFFFGGDLWLLWLVVWVIVVVVLVVGGGFSLWVWIFCAEIDFEWVSQLGLS